MTSVDMTQAGMVKAALLPHPPILVPEVGRGENAVLKDTATSVQKIASTLAELQPEVVVMVTPHGPSFGDCIGLAGNRSLSGDLSGFGAPQVKITVSVAVELVRQIHSSAKHEVAAAILTDDLLARFGIKAKLDHGLMVPLYFLKKAGLSCPVIPVYIGGLPLLEHYRFGMMLQRVLTESGVRAAVIASGDLSHRLTPSAPAGYHPDGKRFDRLVINKLKDRDFAAIVGLDPDFARRAGECGLRPLAVLLGSLDGLGIDVDVRSYQGPFGVGYGVVEFTPTPNAVESLFEKLFEEQKQEISMRRRCESWPVKLAREAVECFARQRRALQPSDVPKEFAGRAGVFVSIKKNGELRGCIGTIEATRENIAAEIVQNAMSAAFDDPRFAPVQVSELDWLVYSVDVLGRPEEIVDKDQLDPERYGVIVRKGRKTGLLLPALPGIDTVDEQLRIAARKAGISDLTGAKLYRFEVVRYE